jgi:hypothetical protein
MCKQFELVFVLHVVGNGTVLFIALNIGETALCDIQYLDLTGFQIKRKERLE